MSPEPIPNRSSFASVRIMAEFGGLHRSLFPIGVFLALVFAQVLTPVPAVGSTSRPPQVTQRAPLPVPGAFRLSASNGFTLYVVGAPPHASQPGHLLIFASASGRGVFYLVPAVVTESSMQASLGELGEISVNFQRSNQATSARCGARTIRFDSGRYEGTIVFHGEEGYTNVEATSVPGNIDYFLSEICGERFVGGQPSSRSRGAELFVRNPGLGPELRVIKSRPGAAALITAWTREYNSGISIERFATQRMPSLDFRYDHRLRTAIVRPPAPFAGSARFDLGKKAGQRWGGDLTVDLPGKAGVPLTGTRLRAALLPTE
jgi:hypothetical protein